VFPWATERGASMPEEDFETGELKERIDEEIERALESEERGSPEWTKYLSLSTAIIAVIAAIASLESGANSNDAMLAKSEAVLHQSRASDQWAYYQAKGVKATVSAGDAEMSAAASPALAAKFREEAGRYKNEQQDIEKSASELESKVKESNELAERFLERHHRFAISVTLFQIAIALCAIAALTRRRALWFTGLAASVVGIALFVRGFLSVV
jgi:Domain of unknown function (DUF4337)